MYNPYWEQAKRAMDNQKPIQETEDKLPPLPTIRKKEKFEDISDYSFKHELEHILVYKHGEFQYSADTMKEAREIFYSGDF